MSIYIYTGNNGNIIRVSSSYKNYDLNNVKVTKFDNMEHNGRLIIIPLQNYFNGDMFHNKFIISKYEELGNVIIDYMIFPFVISINNINSNLLDFGISHVEISILYKNKVIDGIQINDFSEFTYDIL